MKSGHLGVMIMFLTLGPLQIRIADQRIPIDTPSARATLIALLVDEGRPTQAPTLLKRIWENPPRSAASNLRLYVSQLRRQLNSIDPELGDRISTIRGREGESGSYRLHVSPDELDITLFQKIARRGLGELQSGSLHAARDSLTQASNLWYGTIGQGYSVSSQIQAQFDTLSELRITVQERLIEVLLNLGRSTELLPDIYRILNAEPLREKSWENLVRARYLSGDITGALRAWDLAARTIRNELGLDLSPDLQRLHVLALRREDHAIRHFSEFPLFEKSKNSR